MLFLVVITYMSNNTAEHQAPVYFPLISII